MTLTMVRLIFLLEEPSAEEMLKGILPRILPDHVYPEYKIFEGKQDLEKNLARILRAWRTPHCTFVVLRDQDLADCRVVKQKLVGLCQYGRRKDALVRIACRELESFYLGDLAAVEKGLHLKGLANRQRNRKFREPDRLDHPAQELVRLTSGQYSKIAGSRAIGPHMKIEGNASCSFNALISGIQKLTNAF